MTNKSLVIVESPSKAKTISKYLGKDFVVKSSVGHVRRLPKGSKAINLDDWSITYEIDPKKEKVVKDLKTSAKGVANIFLATDLDREGEAIAWHLKEILGKKYNYSRVRFNEITKGAIQEAFEKPGNLDEGLIDAQKTRRILDRIIGYDLSGLMRQVIGGGSTGGRVQSPTLRKIVEREKDRIRFVSANYCTMTAELNSQKQEFFTANYLPSTARELLQEKTISPKMVSLKKAIMAWSSQKTMLVI